MNKKYFYNFFPNEDEFLIASIWDDISLCLDIDYPVCGSIFLPPQVCLKLREVCKFIDIDIHKVGLTPESEKQLVVFTPKNFDSSLLDKVVTYFKIDASNKFKILHHKDFLGAIMSLGLKRETLGDIIVKNNIAYCVAINDIFNIIKDNLCQINTIPINISNISPSEIPPLEFKEIICTVSSLRLDSIVSSIVNSSRNISTELIENGEVFINYNVEKSKNKIIAMTSIITIRKRGKFILEKNLGENKKGKVKILIRQYI